MGTWLSRWAEHSLNQDSERSKLKIKLFDVLKSI